MILNPFLEFMSNNTHTFREFLLNRSKHIFRIYIKHCWHFQGVTPKHYHTFFQTPNSTDISRELLPNNIIHFSRVYIKQYWHFQRVTDKQYYILFQSSYQPILIFSKRYWQAILSTFQELWSTILTFSESYWQTILQTFPDFTSLWNKTYSYWLIQSSCQTVFTLSQSYYQIIGYLNRLKILKQKIPK